MRAKLGFGRRRSGVRFVRKLKFTLANYDNTEIMGASFRNIDQIIALAGLDLLTISPELLDGLKV